MEAHVTSSVCKGQNDQDLFSNIVSGISTNPVLLSIRLLFSWVVSSYMEGNDPAKDPMAMLNCTNLKIYSNYYNTVY